MNLRRLQYKKDKVPEVFDDSSIMNVKSYIETPVGKMVVSDITTMTSRQQYRMPGREKTTGTFKVTARYTYEQSPTSIAVFKHIKDNPFNIYINTSIDNAPRSFMTIPNCLIMDTSFSNNGCVYTISFVSDEPIA